MSDSKEEAFISELADEIAKERTLKEYDKVLNVFDMVFNIDLDETQKELNEEFNEYNNDNNYGGEFNFSTPTTTIINPFNKKTYNNAQETITMQYGKPLLTFLDDTNDDEQIYGTGHFNSIVDVSNIIGYVNRRGNVYIQVKKGGFNSTNVEINNLKPKYYEFIAKYFEDNTINIRISQLKLLPNIQDFIPHNFLYKVIKKDNILRLYITTNKYILSNYNQSTINLKNVQQNNIILSKKLNKYITQNNIFTLLPITNLLFTHFVFEFNQLITKDAENANVKGTFINTKLLNDELKEELKEIDIKCDIKLGFSTNLIYGYSPTYFNLNKNEEQKEVYPKNGLFPSKKSFIKQQYINIENNNINNEWKFPEINFCDDLYQLLSNLYPFKVVDLSDGLDSPKCPCGELLIGDKDSKTSIDILSKALGIKLDNDHGYVIIKIERVNGNASHVTKELNTHIHLNPKNPRKNWGISPDFLDFTKTLTNGKGNGVNFLPNNLTIDDIKKYISLFDQYGTHYVSNVVCGDIIFQIFKYAKDKYNKIKEFDVNDNFKNENIQYFAQYTSNANGVYGYVSEYSKIFSFSNDKNLNESISKGEWKDNTYSGENNILSCVLSSSKIKFFTLKKQFTNIVPIWYELAPLSLFLTFNRKKAFTRILRGIMVSKFHINSTFINYYENIDYSIYGNDTGVLSTISTPFINLYKPVLDISNIQLIAKDIVKEFIIYAGNLLFNSPTPINIPGDDLIIVSPFINSTELQFIPKINSKSKNVIISIQNMSGPLIINDICIIDGIEYQKIDDISYNRYNITPMKDYRKLKLNDTILNKLRTSFQFSYVFLNSRIDIDIVSQNNPFIKSNLIYMSNILSNTKDNDFVKLKLQCDNLLFDINNNNNSIDVPILPYTKYEKEISSILKYVDEINKEISQNQSQIENRKSNELLLNVAKELNSNIITTGKTLNSIIDANADYQKQLVISYTSIAEQTKKEYDQQTNEVIKLGYKLKKAKSNVNDEIENYKKAVKKKQLSEGIQFGLQLATDLFSLGVSSAVPSSAITAVKDLGEIAQKIQKLFNILNNLSKIYQDIKKIESTIKASKEISYDDVDENITSSLDWDVLITKFESIFSKDDKLNMKLVAAFKIMVLIGKTLTETQLSQKQLAKNVYHTQYINEINKEQSKRLNSLRNIMKLEKISKQDLIKIDLIGLTGNLELIRNQIYSLLAKSFVKKDNALTYKYLKHKTQIKQFSLLGFTAANANLDIDANEAEQDIVSIQKISLKPISKYIQILGTNLINGNKHSFHIFPDNNDFSSYFMVYIDSIMVKLVDDSIDSTQSKEYGITLEFSGNSFQQKNYQGKVKGNKPLFNDDGSSWSENVSTITPFGEWKLYFDENFPKNKNIKFKKDLFSIEIIFNVNARPLSVPQPYYMTTKQYISSKSFMSNISFSVRKTRRKTINYLALNTNNKTSNFVNLSIVPTTIDLVSKIHAAQSVLNGWDVVYNMNLSKANSQFQKQWNSIKNDKKYYKNITIPSKTTKDSPLGKYWEHTAFDIEYGPPVIDFESKESRDSDTQHVRISFKIIEGTYKSGYSRTEYGPPEWKKTFNLKDKSFNAIIPIEKIEGTGEIDNNGNIDGAKTLIVGFDLRNGAYKTKNMNINEKATEIQIAQQIKKFFVDNETKYIINRVILNNDKLVSTPDLIPNGFRIKKLVTPNNNNILQLFITTNNRPLLHSSQCNISSVIQEPIPMGYDVSIMISSKILFSSLLTNSTNHGNWELIGCQTNTDDSSSYIAEVKSGTVKSTIDLSELTRHYKGGKVTTKTTVRFPGGEFGGKSTINQSVKGLQLVPTTNGKIELKLEKKDIQKIDTRTRQYGAYGHALPQDSHSQTEFTIVINKTLDWSVLANSEVRLNYVSDDMEVIANISGGAACSDLCNDSNLIADVNKKVKEKFPDELKKNVNLNMHDVYVFAIKNILFQDSVVKLKKVYSPNLLILFGDINEK